MVKLIAFLKSKPGMTREEFAQRWVNEHTKISARLPGVRGYRINIATERQPESGGAVSLFDGTAEMWWDSIDEMEASFATELGQLAGSDGDSFTTVRLHLYTDEYEIVPGPDSHGPRWRQALKTIRARANSKPRAKSRPPVRRSKPAPKAASSTRRRAPRS